MNVLTHTHTFSISPVPLKKVEFADVVLINKMDLVSEEQASQIEAIVKKLNPAATIYRTTRSDVPMSSIINTGLFSFEKAASSVGWLTELRGAHKPETVEYGSPSLSVVHCVSMCVFF